MLFLYIGYLGRVLPMGETLTFCAHPDAIIIQVGHKAEQLPNAIKSQTCRVPQCRPNGESSRTLHSATSCGYSMTASHFGFIEWKCNNAQVSNIPYFL